MKGELMRLPVLPTQKMRDAWNAETPYVMRRALDKSCYEVAKAANEDFAECVEDFKVLKRFQNYQSAEKFHDYIEFEWRYSKMIEAI